MFGYIAINKKMLTLQDQQLYRSFYCGVCRALRQRFGTACRLLLSYDMAFLALLLSSLFDDDGDAGVVSTPPSGQMFCLLHPQKKMQYISNEYIDYAADMTVLLAYHKLRDNWYDDHDHLSRAEAQLLKKQAAEVFLRHPCQAAAVNEYIAKQTAAEQQQEQNIEDIATLTGRMLGELLVLRPSPWQEQLRELGLHLGKFIYLMDAYEDIEDDIKKQRHNPLISLYQQNDFEQRCRGMLENVMSACADVFERLPITTNSSLLRHIIYDGVWSRFAVISRHRIEKQHRKNKPADSAAQV